MPQKGQVTLWNSSEAARSPLDLRAIEFGMLMVP